MPELQSESDDDEEEDVIIDIAGKEDSSNTSSEGEESQDETPEISNNDEFEEDLSHLFCVTRRSKNQFFSSSESEVFDNFVAWVCKPFLFLRILNQKLYRGYQILLETEMGPLNFFGFLYWAA
eukprot:gene16427-18062_t